MWTRRELKERAKSVLRRIYWKAFWVSIVIALATGGNGGNSGGDDDKSGSVGNALPDERMFFEALSVMVIAIGVFLIILLLRIFLGYPLEVGGRRYFVRSAQYNDNKKCFSFAFRAENYLGIAFTMLLRDVFNFLWFLLLIIPGIVKAYAYIMVPYILADNPNIGYRKAIKLSDKMTKGYKLDIFILDLSFIGWYLLGVLALIVGILFVLPYHDATKAELYLELRKNALENELCSYEDLSLNRPE